jgi:hypothetical protein
MFWLDRHFFSFQLFLGMVLGVLLDLCMDGQHLGTTKYGVEWAFSCAWVDMSFLGSILLPSFANLSASSLPLMLVYALTMCRVVGALWSFSSFTIKASILFSGWLFCCVGCFI